MDEGEIPNPTNSDSIPFIMIKTALLAITSTLALSAGAAQAYAPEAYSFAGHRGTVIERGAWEKDTITLSGPQGSTTIEVLCTGNGGNEWTSYGNTSQAFNQAVANSWCRSF